MKIASNRKDLSGMVFNNLTVLNYSHTDNKRAYWNCICACGKEKKAQGKLLLSGSVKSCGCLNHLGNTKHGMNKSSEYCSWASMKSRCLNPNYPKFKSYGARGILICDRWVNSFENFLADMGAKPTLSHTIERIDVNGNYEPSNCYWATSKEQSINKRNTAIILNSLNGIFYYGYKEAAKSVGINSSALYAQLNGIVSNRTKLLVTI